MLLSIGLLGLLGCPLPPDDQASNTAPSFQQGNGAGQTKNNPAQNGGRPQGAPPAVGENQGQQATNQEGTAGGIGGGAGGGQGTAGGTLMDMEQMKSQKKQDEIGTLEHITISGVIEGECKGLLRLDVISTEDLGGPKDGGEMKGPITTKVLENTGAFSILVPKSSSVTLSVICDTDRNNKITADVDKLSLGARLGVVDADVSDVSLVLEDIKPPSGDLPPPK